ncbi:MAG: TonB-dependent receptor [candidate division KSB1 bacterium]|nr:TonB-dependent receptor [candidate division KSB1 bacterium]
MSTALRRFCLSLVLVLMSSSIYAGTTGKIAGTVRDKKTGEALPGVNVFLEGTSIGAATNTDGYYVILNVPPGVYKLKATMIGYADVTIQNVRVQIDLTANIDIEMTPVVLATEEVVVLAERPVVQPDVAASHKSITSNQIRDLPMTSVSEIIGLQAGITSGLSIRGSGPDQALFMVDGVVLRDERTNRPIAEIPLSAVQEVSVQTGGFGAEYHNLRSGVVNVVTKEGDPDRYTGTITYKIRPPAPKHFGISPYDPNSFWLRPYLDPAVCWTGTKNGAWDEFMQRQYPEFEGWVAVSERTLQDDDPTNDLTPEAAQRIFMWEHRKQGEIDKPDYYIDAGFGGPVPLVSKMLGNLRFYASYRQERDMYLIELSRDALTKQTLMLKLTSDVGSNMKLSVLGIYGETHGTSLSRSGGTAMMTSVYDVARQMNRAGFTVPWRIYTNIYWSPTSRYYHALSAKFTHVLSPSTFYEVYVKRVGKKYFTAPGRHRDRTKKYEIFPGYFVDEAPYGFEENPVFGIDGLGMGGAVSTSRDYSRVTTTTAKIDLISQINSNNQVKTGLEFVYDDFNMSFGMVNKFLPEGNTWTRIRRNPYRLTYYLQDKLEFKGFISIVGLVTEYTNPNGNWYDVTDYDREFFSQKFRPEDEEKFLKKRAEPRLTFSPRLAVSHPITENSKLYFNYGHYRQVATSERLYRVQRSLTNQVDFIGNPTIPLAKTVAYELGYEHALFSNYLLHISAYYKDITDQEFWVRYISFDGKVNYRKLTNNSYEDIRGFELELTKMWGRWFTGHINYEYRVGTSAYFGSAIYYENPAEQREYLRRNPPQFKPRPRPRVKSTLNLHTPQDFGPMLAGHRPLAGWNFNFIGYWTAGSWFTWNPNNVPGIEYNVQWRDYYNVDLKISKTFSFDKFDVRFFADIFNLFNIRRFSGVSFFNLHDFNYYMKSLHLPEDIGKTLGYGNIPGNDRPGDYRKEGVEFQPMEWVADINQFRDPNPKVIYWDARTRKYMQYVNDNWKEVDSGRIKEILDTKAYIDMPNQTFFTFLNPRSIFIGLTFNYRF